MVRQTDTGSPDAVEHRRRGRRRHPAPRTVGVAFRHGTTTLDPVALPDEVIASLPPTNHASLPALADHWQRLDLREILSRPAAFISIGQSNSVYRPGGVQYSFWTDEIGATQEQIGWDITLVEELQAIRQPQDKELFETALQSWFVGTDLPGTLARRKIEVLVFAGVHVDWCIEGNVRAARDNGLLPIVIDDACGAQRPEQEAATFDRINRFFAPVITAEQFVDLVQR